MSNKANTIDEYISMFPADVQPILEKIRTTIKKTVPGAVETISYAIPCFKLDKAYLVYFAGFKSHIGMYPVPTGKEEFKKDFSKYKTGKASVQFPLNEPLPISLIIKIVKFRIKEQRDKLIKKPVAKKAV